MIASSFIDSFTRSDRGRVRTNNEDAVGGFEPTDAAVRAERGCLFVVADGMGGHAAGEVASNYAVGKILHAYYSLPWAGAEQTLAIAIQDANAEINAEGQRSVERRGMGSTVVAAAVLDDRAVIANVGDSRAYLLRGDALQPLTRDHSWVAEHLADGTITPEQAIDHPSRNILTRNLGLRPTVEPDVRSLDLQPGDRLLRTGAGAIAGSDIAASICSPATGCCSAVMASGAPCPRRRSPPTCSAAAPSTPSTS